MCHSISFFKNTLKALAKKLLALSGCTHPGIPHKENKSSKPVVLKRKPLGSLRKEICSREELGRKSCG